MANFVAAVVGGVILSNILGGGGSDDKSDDKTETKKPAPEVKPVSFKDYGELDYNKGLSFDQLYKRYEKYIGEFSGAKWKDYKPTSVTSDYLGGTRFANDRQKAVAEADFYNNKVGNIQDFDTWLAGQGDTTKNAGYGSQRADYLKYVEGEYGNAPTMPDRWYGVADGLKAPNLKKYDAGAYDPGYFTYTEDKYKDYIGGKVYRTEAELIAAKNAADFEYGKDKYGNVLDAYGVDYNGMTSAEMASAFGVASTVGAQADLKQQKIDEIQKALDEASGSYDAIKSEYDAKLTDFADLQKQFDDLYGSYNALTGTYGAQQKEYEDLFGQYTTAQDELLGLQDQLKEQGSIYDTLTGEFDTLTGEYKTLQDEFAGLGDEYAGLKGKYGSLQDEYSGLQGQFGGLQDEYDVLSGQYTDTLGALDAQKALYEQAQADIRKDFIMDTSKQTLANKAAQDAAQQAKVGLGQMPTVPTTSPLEPASYTQMPVDYLSGFSPSLFEAPDLSVEMPDFTSAYTPVQLPQQMAMTPMVADYSQPFTGYLDAINNQYGVSPQSAYSGIMGARK